MTAASSDGFHWLDAHGGDPALIERVDLEGEIYAGETYAWTGRGPIRHVFQAPEEGPVTAMLWLRWGSKGDRRRARITIGDSKLSLEREGDQGFGWWPIVVPREWWKEGKLIVVLEAESGSGPHAFLSELRLRRVRESAEPIGESIFLEAESFEGPWRLQRNVPGYSGDGFRVSNASGIAERPLRSSFSLTSASRIFLWARAYEGNGQDRRFALAVDGVELPATHHETVGRGFTWRLAGSMQLAAGEHHLEVRDRGPGFEVVDAIWATADPLFDPGLVERVRQGLPRRAEPGLVDRIVEETAASAEEAHERIARSQRDADAWRAERERLRQRLRRALGLEPLPVRSPLNVRSVGTVERDGYRIEKIIFESRPGFEVPANVYVPADVGPGERRPAVLNPVGHWGRSKAEPVVQARCIGLAKLGYVALTYDAFGQGERAIPGNGHGEYHRTILAGRNNMSYMVWDTTRALDYLLTRPDVDPERIACTGASGGGLNTLYASAIDERIRVAVPVVYVTRLRDFLETGIGHCPCSHVNELASFADMGDVAGLVAPRPQLFITATHDGSFTPAGARGAAEQARSAYAVFRAADRLAVQEFDAAHDYNRAMREAMYRFLAEHFGDGEAGRPIQEPPIEVESDLSVLSCYPGDRQPPGAVTVRDLGRAEAEDRLAEVKAVEESEWRECLGAKQVPPARRVEASVDPGWRALQDRLAVEPEGANERWSTSTGIDLVVRRQEGGDPRGPIVIWLGEDVPPEDAVSMSSAWWAVSGLSLEDDGQRHLAITDSHLLGDPLPLRRARALAEALRSWQRTTENGEERWVLVAPGAATALPALLAASLIEGLDRLIVRGLPSSWLDCFEGSSEPTEIAVWRATFYGDVEDWLARTKCDWKRWDDEPLAGLLGEK